MRVLLISHTCQSPTEGQPKADFLGREPDIELRVLVPDRWRHYGRWRRPEQETDSPFCLQECRVRWPWLPGAQNYLHYYPELGRVLREFRPDVIDLWEEPWGLVSAHACWLRNWILPEAKIVAETEQNIEKTLPPPFEQFRAHVHSSADFLVGRSNGAVEVSRSKGYRGPTEVVPNGCDTELFRPLDRIECRRRLFGNPRSGAFIAGYVGRLVPEKGVEDLVEALRACPKNVHLLFIGAGPLRDFLETKALKHGLSDRIRILDARPLDELPEVMNAIDVLVLPSRTTSRWKEQFGRVIIEAQACGTPVIGSDSGAIPDVIGEGGLVVPEWDPDALAHAMKSLAGDAPTSRRMGKAGRQRVLATSAWQQVANRMAAIYRRLAGEQSSSRTVVPAVP